MEKNDLIALTADIVSAHVSANSVTANDLPRVIQLVYEALDGLGQAVPPEEAKREPAVPLRSSVKPDAITCLECGARMKLLKRHLGTDHGLTPADYRARWSLNSNYPMIAPDYAVRRRELAVSNGLGRKPGQGRKGGTTPVSKAQMDAAPIAVETTEAPKRKVGRPRKVAVKENTTV